MRLLRAYILSKVPAPIHKPVFLNSSLRPNLNQDMMSCCPQRKWVALANGGSLAHYDLGAPNPHLSMQVMPGRGQQCHVNGWSTLE